MIRLSVAGVLFLVLGTGTHASDDRPPTPAPLQPHRQTGEALAETLTTSLGIAQRLGHTLDTLQKSADTASTLEDALQKVSQQKSLLEAELAAHRQRLQRFDQLAGAEAQALRDREAYRQETERLRRQLAHTHGLLDVTLDALAKVTRQKSHLESALVSGQREAALQLEAQRLENAEDREAHMAALAENRNLQVEKASLLADLQQARDRTQAAEAQVASLTEDHQQLANAAAAQEARLAQQDQALLEAQSARDSALQALEQARLTEATAAQEAAQAKTAAQETSAALAEARASWLLTEKNLTARLTEAQENQTTLADQNRQLRQSLDTTRTQLSTAEENLESQKAALTESRNALAQTQERLRAAEDALKNADLARAEWIQKHRQAAADLQAAENEADTWKLQFAELEKRFQDARDTSKDTRALEETLATLQQEDLQQKERLATLQSELESARQEAAGNAVDQERLATLQSELESARQEAAGNAVDQERLATLQSELDTARERVATVNSRADQLNQTFTSLQADLTMRERHLATLKSRLAEEEERRRAIETELARRQDELETARKGHQTLLEEFLHIDPVRYELNSTQIDDEQARVLSRVRSILSLFPQATFHIGGHTCNLGTAEDNHALSQQRARRLLDFLVANGIDPDQVQAEGFGEERPVADNETEEGRRRNRRVEIEVTSPGLTE